MATEHIFLTAEWRDLLMLNYEVDPALLLPLVPPGTTLDRWQGHTFISLVGFCFLNTKVFGIPIPFHRNFEEVNLRFYVARQQGDEVRRGVVFIREIVPRIAIAAVARTVYNENYVALPMTHEVARSSEGAIAAEYAWRRGDGWNRIRGTVTGEPLLPSEGSKEQFITEHYWGYAAQRDGGCKEYRVAHPSWRAWTSRDAAFSGDASEVYGGEIAEVLHSTPASVFLAEGSEVTVFKGRKL